LTQILAHRGPPLVLQQQLNALRIDSPFEILDAVLVSKILSLGDANAVLALCASHDRNHTVLNLCTDTQFWINFCIENGFNFMVPRYRGAIYHYVRQLDLRQLDSVLPGAWAAPDVWQSNKQFFDSHTGWQTRFLWTALKDHNSSAARKAILKGAKITNEMLTLAIDTTDDDLICIMVEDGIEPTSKHLSELLKVDTARTGSAIQKFLQTPRILQPLHVHEVVDQLSTDLGVGGLGDQWDFEWLGPLCMFEEHNPEMVHRVMRVVEADNPGLFFKVLYILQRVITYEMEYGKEPHNTRGEPWTWYPLKVHLLHLRQSWSHGKYH
jgi:hypothetical protein